MSSRGMPPDCNLCTRARLTMEELLKENKKLDVSLAGLKA
jgi:hypothetical protein